MLSKTILRAAIVYPSGKFQKTAEEKVARISQWEQEGFEITDLEPNLDSLHGVTAGPVLERTALLSHALTNRKFDILLAGRGGYGATELIPFLEFMLPPVLPPKTLVGFSDISYLGVYLSLRFPNFRYIHAKNAFSEHLFLDEHSEKTVLFNLLKAKETGQKVPSNQFECDSFALNKAEITGVCIPLNLSLAESLAATKGIVLPPNTILFLEDCNEHLHRLLRKIDSLINSGFMENVTALVLGDFTEPIKHNEEEISRQAFLQLVADKTHKPTIDFPFFGHNKYCFPLVAHSKILIKKIQNDSTAPKNAKVHLTLTHTLSPRNALNLAAEEARQASIFAACSTHASRRETQPQRTPPSNSIHFAGIGGTGMASVAGLLKSAGYEVSGSDNTIYPPMDKVLADLHIVPDVGFKKENVTKRAIDAIIMGNVMSRKTAALEKNEELEEILQHRIPVMSFPSALRRIFLNQSFNVVVSGTHGKTTTSSLFAFLLKGLSANPSFLIGGMPGNFGQGFGLNERSLFVLEGDEYDSAFFDKGPKFLHYEPSVTLINNIEFDHADIYENVEAIENEFLRLAELTRDRNGFNIVNWNDARVRQIALAVKGNRIAFGGAQGLDPAVEPREPRGSLARQGNLKPQDDNAVSSRGSTAGSRFPPDDIPMWLLNSFDTAATGITIHCTAPNQTSHSFFCNQIFGAHNAFNMLGVLAGLHAIYLFNHKSLENMLQDISKIQDVLKDFKGVKRRFELLGHKNEITVFDDFAHHPTAVRTTLQAFRDYMNQTKKQGRLIVCFDPHNATMRRNIMQDELAKSFASADLLFLGKIPKDLRMNQDHTLDGEKVVQTCGIQAHYFDENQKLLDALQKEVRANDTIVFMSSGSFDGIAHQFANALGKELS